MSLKAVQVQQAKPGAKPYKLADGGGLYLLVKPTGQKYWRFKYRVAGKEKLLAVGVFPDLSLMDARARRDEARRLLANGADPSEVRKAQKIAMNERAANSFEVVAREWFAKHQPTWVAGHADKIISRLDRDIFPWLGAQPIAEITAPDLLKTLRRIESRGALETTHRALQSCGQIFRYAIATGRASSNPADALRGALQPATPQHLASITDPAGVAELLRVIDGYQGSLVTKCALRLAPLVFVRPGELRHAQWADVDLESATWTYTASKTKTPHVVPLSTHAVEILKELKPLTGEERYLFPGVRGRDRPMSENTVNAALRRLGYTGEQFTGHGFRAMARTVLDEVLHYRPDYIEHQLAHAVRDPNGRAYNRTAHLPERRAMMQGWADYLDSLKRGGKVVPLRAFQH